MKIMIFGGTGLIGTALRKSFQKDNHEIVVVSRKSDGISPAYKTISWDPESIIHEMVDTDAVINLAGASISGSNPFLMRWTSNRKNEILNSRLEAGKNITEAIRKSPQKPEVLIQASAIGYYGNTGSIPVEETDLPGVDFLADVCQVWEESTSAVETFGVRRVTIRIGLVLSGDGGLLPLLILPFKLYLGGKIGTGKQLMSWIHISDVVQAIIYLVGNPQTVGIYNLTAPNPVENQELAKFLKKSTRKPAWLPLPAWVLKVVLGEAATLALDGREVLPKRLLEAGYQFRYPSILPALDSIIRLL